MSDYETCSWCCVEILAEDLTETDEGNLCPDCYTEYVCDPDR